MLSHGVRTMSTPPRYSLTASASAGPYPVPETTVNASRTCSPHHPRTDIVPGEFGHGMTVFWRRIVDEPDAFPPQFWQLFLQPSLTALGGNNLPVCGHSTEEAHRGRGCATNKRPQLEEVNGSLGSQYQREKD